MAKIIDSLTLGSTTGVLSIPYTTCATAAATAAKVATLTTFALETGAQVRIKFTYANSVANPTLNINGTGAKAIFWRGAALASTQYWAAGQILDFIYDGTNWVLITQSKDNDTKYTLPAAGSALGGVKTGGDVTIADGIITVNDDSHNHTIANIDGLQTKLDAKQATITGAATTITSSNLTANRALISNGSGKVAVSAVTSTELGYLDGVTSAVQTQLNDKVSKSSTSVQTINGGLNIGGTPTAGTGVGRIMLTGNTNPLIGLQAIDADGNKLTPYYFQVTNNMMYLGPTSSKALSLDSNGNTSIPANLTVTGTITGNLNGNATSANKVNHTLTIGGKTYNGSADVLITAANLGIDNALHFIGVKDAVPTTGTYANGDVILVGNKEYVYSNSAWVELGDGSDFALKTINITAGNGLTGGGTLASSRTLNVGAGTGITVSADAVAAKLRSTTALTNDSAAATEVANRVYPIAVDKSGYLAVNVPWVDTNTKVTSVDNHYTPSANSSSALSVDASSATAATWGTTSLVTGVNLQRDAKGHVTGLTVDSIKMPANPDTNTAFSYLTGWADTRNVATTPNDYNRYLKVVGIKTPTASGLTSAQGGSYATLVGIRGWNDSSGGNSHEIAFAGNGSLYHRHGATTTWSAWDKIITNSTIPAATTTTLGGVKVSSVSTGTITVNSKSTIAERYYPVELNGDQKLIVNVPWTDNNTVTTVTTTGSGNAITSITATNGAITATKGATFKTTQTAVSDPTANGSTTAFIDTISQNANGVITVTKKNLDTSGTWSGNAATATGFATAKTIALTGNVTGSATGGSGNKGWSIATTIASIPNEALPLRLRNYQATGFDDANEATESGFHYMTTAATNRPPFEQNTANKNYRILATSYSSSWVQQIATDFRSDEIYFRRCENGTWKNWVNLPLSTASTSGNTYTPLYLNKGLLTVGTSYAKAIKSITRSGTTFTYTCIDGTTGSFTQQDNNTTYSAGTGLSLSGTTFNHSNTITAGSVGTAQSPSHGGTFAIPKITYDAQGHITGATTVNITLPADNNTDTKVTTAAQTSSKIYVTGCTGATTGTLQYNTNVYISGNVMYGACWNDYAEYRISDCQESGRVICENGDDTLSLATERLQPAGNVISDTFGFAIGETEMAKTPIAVSGRVLVYPYEDRYSYNPGDAVCAAPGGTVSKMTREEIITYPERIIGTVSAIPEYETWGEGNVPVNGRIWIKVK